VSEIRWPHAAFLQGQTAGDLIRDPLFVALKAYLLHHGTTTICPRAPLVYRPFSTPSIIIIFFFFLFGKSKK